MIVDLIFGILFALFAATAVYVLLKVYIEKVKLGLPFIVMLYITIIIGVLSSAYTLNEYLNVDEKQTIPTTYKENIKSV